MEGLIFGILRYLIIIPSVYMYDPIPGPIFGGHFHIKVLDGTAFSVA